MMPCLCAFNSKTISISENYFSTFFYTLLETTIYKTEKCIQKNIENFNPLALFYIYDELMDMRRIPASLTFIIHRN